MQASKAITPKGGKKEEDGLGLTPVHRYPVKETLTEKGEKNQENAGRLELPENFLNKEIANCEGRLQQGGFFLGQGGLSVGQKR